MLGTHYHIHWSGKKLGWERFDTRKNDEKRARQQVQFDETYTIELMSSDCENCAATKQESFQSRAVRSPHAK